MQLGFHFHILKHVRRKQYQSTYFVLHVELKVDHRSHRCMIHDHHLLMCKCLMVEWLLGNELSKPIERWQQLQRILILLLWIHHRRSNPIQILQLIVQWNLHWVERFLGDELVEHWRWKLQQLGDELKQCHYGFVLDSSSKVKIKF